jgi:hypothetical protein
VVYFGTIGAGAFKSNNAGSSLDRDVHSHATYDLDVAVDPADGQVRLRRLE